jgi:hypothetical protein
VREAKDRLSFQDFLEMATFDQKHPPDTWWIKEALLKLVALMLSRYTERSYCSDEVRDQILPGSRPPQTMEQGQAIVRGAFAQCPSKPAK